MKMKKKRFLGILLSLALVFGLMPGMSLTVYAADPYASLKNSTTVITFDSKPWYLIDYDSSTVTLLAKECVGASRFGSNSTYNGSNVETAVNNYYRDYISAAAKTAVSGTGMFLLTTVQAQNITNVEVRKCPQATGTDFNYWWLSSRYNNTLVTFVQGDDGTVRTDGLRCSFTVGVRPALKLDLSSVIFSSNTFTVSHFHDFTYTADGVTITATCTADGCTLPPSTDGGSDHVATLTISANGGTYDGTTAYAATITDANSIQGDAKVEYQKKTDGSYGTATETAPKDAGDYKASITVGGATASVEYTIAKAVPTITTAPTAGEITYGQTLANSNLSGGAANKDGSFAWKDATVAPAVADSQTTEYDVVFTPTDGNYGTAECKVKLTVNKADSAVTKAPTAKTLTYTGSPQALVSAGTAEGGEMQYALGTATKATEQYTTSIPTATDAGTYYVWYKVEGDANHEDSKPQMLEVTIAEMAEANEQFFTSMKVQQKNGKLKISWDKTDAKKVEVYATYCGNDFPAKPIKTTTGTSVTLKKINGKKIDFSKSFKIYLKGYGSKDQEIGKTVSAYVAGKNNKKYTNVKSIKVNNAKITLTKGNSTKIAATLKLENKKKTMFKKNKVEKLRFVSTNTSVATVDKNGNVTGVSAGTCDVYVYAVNGLAKKVQVTVTE